MHPALHFPRGVTDTVPKLRFVAGATRTGLYDSSGATGTVHTPDAFCTARAPTLAHEASGVAPQSDGSNNVSAATAQPRVPMLSLSLARSLSHGTPLTATPVSPVRRFWRAPDTTDERRRSSEMCQGRAKIVAAPRAGDPPSDMCQECAKIAGLGMHVGSQWVRSGTLHPGIPCMMRSGVIDRR